MKTLFPTIDKFYCPLCDNEFPRSEFLKNKLQDEKQEWLSTMITHHRNYHIGSFRRSEKQSVDERAKRQIIRKALPFLKENEIGKEHFLKLFGISVKTCQLLTQNF